MAEFRFFRGYFFPLFVLHLLLNILLLFIPLTRFFSYENAVVNTLLLAIYSGLFFSSKEAAPLWVFSVQILLLWVITPVVFLVFGINSPNCSYAHGMKFYILGTIPGIITGTFLFLSAKLLTARFALLLFSAGLFFITVTPLFEFYFLPQIKFYNPIVFYFPGTIYDDLIQVNMTLIAHRLITSFSFILLYIVIRKYKPNLIRTSLGIILGILVYYIVLAPAFGFVITNNRLEKSGYKTVETEHFIITLPVRITGEVLKTITNYHEFQYEDLKRAFNESPDEKISSYIYANTIDKQIFFGTASADVAKPWRNEIHTTINSIYSNLRHELAHVFAGTFANPPFRVAAGINPFLIEGFASAISPNYDDIDYKLLLKSGVLISDIESESFSGADAFFSLNTRLAYYLSGEFVKYLIGAYGIDSFKTYYRSGRFEDVYKRDLASEMSSFFTLLKDYPKQSDTLLYKYYFSAMPPLKRICPRYTAEIQNEAVKSIADSNFAEAEHYTSQLMRMPFNRRNFLIRVQYLERVKEFGAIAEMFTSIPSQIIKDDFTLKLLKHDYKVKSGGQVNLMELNTLVSETPNLRLRAAVKTRIHLSVNGKLGSYLDANDSTKVMLLSENGFDSLSFLWLNIMNNSSIPYNLMEELVNTKNIDEFTELAKLEFVRKILPYGKINECRRIISSLIMDKLPSGSKFELEIIQKFLNYLNNQKLY